MGEYLMTNDKLFLSLLNEEDQLFSGWDFSFITSTGRMQNELLSWSYGSLAKSLIIHSNSILDMGTGGGEFLSMLQPLPKTVFATEGYEPNVSIAKSRLEPLGVKVVQIKNDEHLPFHKQQFDLILNRHESYSPGEVRRIIIDQGIFLTQQVGGQDCLQLNEMLEVPINEEYIDWNLETAIKELKKHHFQVLFCKEEFPIQRFYDIGAIVYYLKAIPWQIPNFKAQDYMEQLFKLHQHIRKYGYLDVKQHRFIIKAKAM